MTHLLLPFCLATRAEKNNKVAHFDSLLTATQREMMFINLVKTNYLNNNNLTVMHSLAYANIKCNRQLLLQNTLHCYHTFQSTIFSSSN